MAPDAQEPLDRLDVVQGDITSLQVDAIVNAANTSLLGGGGVDGAIHRAAGPQLLEECRGLGGCPTGEARITAGYRLPADWVIHTPGPVWHGGGSNEDALLAACYRNSLVLARDHDARSVAFPAISTGVYGFPIDRATAIAVETVTGFLSENTVPERVVFCCFSEADTQVYRRRIDERRRDSR
jgi:O-acetyl-ADP-ribose deacetylase (regulator of RNase III)